MGTNERGIVAFSSRRIRATFPIERSADDCPAATRLEHLAIFLGFSRAKAKQDGHPPLLLTRALGDGGR